ncbi:Acetylornithine aminotransferase, partial [Dysosmobacter welbionis]
QRHGERALGVAGTGQEAAEPAGLYHQIPPALRADLLADLVGHLDAGAVQSLFGVLQVLLKVPVELPQHVLPGGLSLLHGVQPLFHIGGEFQIRDVGEPLFHQGGHHTAQVGDAEVLALLHHVLPVQDGGHSGSVSGGAADALLLHGPDQRGVCIVGRGLGEVLLPVKVLQGQRFALPQGGQGGFLLLFLLVLALLIHGGVAGEFQAGGAGPEAVSRRLDLHGHAVVHGVGHLAGQKAAPHQAVEAVLLAGQVLFQLLRRPVDVAGADGLVGVLGARLGLVAVGLGVMFAVAARNEGLGGGQGLLTDPQGVGTHIGDEAHGALALDIHALVQLLGDGHGPPGRHGELAGRLLLHGGGGEGRRGAALLVCALHGLDGEGGVLRLMDHSIHVLRRL